MLAIPRRIADRFTTFAMERAHLKRTFHVAALLSLLAFTGTEFSVSAQNSPTIRPDGIFTPTISPVTAIDKTGHPTTVEVSKSEPRLA
jgi:hypothetical protein